jgi:RNA ligase (TIGR02306 family)
MRKLVTINLIDNIAPIEGADLIETVYIKGWTCVSKKGEFTIGDKCVYFEIDSFLPIQDKYEFLRKSSYRQLPSGNDGFRIRTTKLRGQLSQGLVLPLSLFTNIIDESIEVGMDVTDLLDVTKFEKPLSPDINKDICGHFPSFIPKTEEERIQNLPHYFNTFKDVLFEETVKYDGTSMTVFRTAHSVDNTQTMVDDRYTGRIGCCIRNYELKHSESNTLWKVANELNLPMILDNENLEIAIQGELMGKGIQGNREQLDKHTFYIFRIWDIKEKRFWTSQEKDYFINRVYTKFGISLEHVQINHKAIDIFNQFNNVSDLLKYAEGPSLNHKVREGLVFKSIEPVNGNIVTFKVISNKFLLKGGD